MHKNQRGQEDGFFFFWGVDFRYDVLSQDVKLVLVSCYNILCY